MQNRILTGRIALITGASRGLGYAVARGLTAHGARVLAAARSASELAVASEIEAVARDVLARHGQVDVLVNNAAVPRTKPFSDLTPAECEDTLVVNLLAPVRLTRALLPAMLARRMHGALVTRGQDTVRATPSLTCLNSMSGSGA